MHQCSVTAMRKDLVECFFFGCACCPAHRGPMTQDEVEKCGKTYTGNEYERIECTCG